MPDISTIDKSVATLIERAIPTTDNKFEQETHALSSLRPLSKNKLLVVCNGDGTMSVRYLGDPIELIKKLGALRDKDLITSEQFETLRSKLLGQIG